VSVRAVDMGDDGEGEGEEDEGWLLVFGRWKGEMSAESGVLLPVEVESIESVYDSPFAHIGSGSSSSNSPAAVNESATGKGEAGMRWAEAAKRLYVCKSKVRRCTQQLVDDDKQCVVVGGKGECVS
jgi:hypothetical protein